MSIPPPPPPPAQPHAQSVFLFPIVFGINLIYFFDEKKNGAAGNSIVCFAASNPCHAIWPFDSANFTKNANCSEEWNVFGNGKCELSANQERRNEGANFWQGKVQNSSPILRCKFLARKSAKLIANFSATKVTSLPSISLSLYLSFSLSLSLSLSHRAHLTHNIGNASGFPIILDVTRPQTNSDSVCVSLCAGQVFFDTV